MVRTGKDAALSQEELVRTAVGYQGLDGGVFRFTASDSLHNQYLTKGEDFEDVQVHRERADCGVTSLIADLNPADPWYVTIDSDEVWEFQDFGDWDETTTVVEAKKPQEEWKGRAGSRVQPTRLLGRHW